MARPLSHRQQEVIMLKKEVDETVAFVDETTLGFFEPAETKVKLSLEQQGLINNESDSHDIKNLQNWLNHAPLTSSQVQGASRRQSPTASNSSVAF